MALTRLQQGQISGTLGDNVSDSVTNANLLKANRTLEDDLNSLRSQIKRIQGTAAWTEELSGSQDLAVVYGAMHVVDTTDVQFQGDLFVSGAAEVSGTLKVISNAISGSDGLNITLGAAGHVSVAGDLQVMGDDLSGSLGGNMRFEAAGKVVVAGDLQVDGDAIRSSTDEVMSFSGDTVTIHGLINADYGQINMSSGVNINTGLSGNDSTPLFSVSGGDLYLENNKIRSSDDVVAITLSNTDVAVAGDLKVGGNDIKASDNTVALTLSDVTGDVAVAGDLQVSGDDIKSSTGNVAISFFDQDVTVAGDLTVGGNEIKASNGTVALTLSDFSGNVAVFGTLKVVGDEIKASDDTTTLTLFPGSGDIIVAGDLVVGGNDIASWDGSIATIAITLSGTDVTVAGDLKVGGNDIKSSTGDTAITLAGANVSMPGNLTVTGDLIVQGSTTVVDSENLLVKDAIVGFGYASGSVEQADGDRGFIFALSGDNSTMFWDDSASEFKLAFTADSPATGTISTTGYADLRAGVVTAEAGFSGSLTKLVDGSDYLIADVGVSITVNENGSITIGGASDSYAKGYFDVGDVVSDVIDFSASLGELSEAVDKNVDVYLNGVLLRSGAGFDVVSISSTSVTLNSAIAADLQAEDVITIVVRSLLPA